MNEELRDLLKSIELQDIYVDGFSSQTVNRELLENSVNIKLLEKRDLDSASLSESEDGKNFLIEVRYYLGVLLVDPGKEGKKEAEKAGFIECHMIAKYLLTGLRPNPKTVEDFAKTSVLFNLWPYWREFVQTASVRLRWPVVLMPLFKFINSTTPTSSVPTKKSSASKKLTSKPRNSKTSKNQIT
jgi:hypothetical protein